MSELWEIVAEQRLESHRVAIFRLLVPADRDAGPSWRCHWPFENPVESRRHV